MNKSFNYNLMKRTCCICFFVLLFVSVSAASAQSISHIQALGRVKQLYASDSSKCIFSYASVNSLVSNQRDSVTAVIDWLSDSSSKWLIFVDEDPFKNWAHRCSYYYFPQTIVDSDTLSFFKIEGRHPPIGVNLFPEKIFAGENQILGSSLIIPQFVDDSLDILTNPCHFYPEDRFAVIVATGYNDVTHYSSFINDAAYLYRTLVNKYNYCPNNIHMFFGNQSFNNYVTRRARDVDGNAYYWFEQFNSDLDGDGVAEPFRCATRSELYDILEQFGGEDVLNDRQQLLFFFIGHGDVDNTGPHLCLPVSYDIDHLDPYYDPLYDFELAALLDSIHAGATTVVLGNCFSGAFIDTLKARNRVILAACGANEESYCDSTATYDLFVRHWTDAINGCDSIGTINSDADFNGRITMRESFDYALSKEYPFQIGNELIEEHPLYCSMHEALGDDLTLDIVPEAVDLYIRDDVLDTGKEYNMAADPTDNSPDIWLRNQNDGLYNDFHENVTTDGESKTAYIFTRVSNRGLQNYQYGNKKLNLYWVDSSLGIDSMAWFHPIHISTIPSCGLIASIDISNLIIESDSSVVVGCIWAIPSSLCQPYGMVSGTIDLGLLAVVEDSVPTMIDNHKIYKILVNKTKNNDVALRNMTINKINPGGDIGGPIIIGITGSSMCESVTITISEPAQDATCLTVNSIYDTTPLICDNFEEGNNSVNFSAGQWASGVYVLTLSVDGKVVDTKKMFK
ncbi:MAG: caspase family protein [Muribaculaceae bacterium]|nr:caspase family protein [Muribaculaceae bacterium]